MRLLNSHRAVTKISFSPIFTFVVQATSDAMLENVLCTAGNSRDSSCSSFSPTYIASMCNALLTMSSLILIVSLDGIPLFRSVISWIRSWSMLLGPSFIISR